MKAKLIIIMIRSNVLSTKINVACNYYTCISKHRIDYSIHNTCNNKKINVEVRFLVIAIALVTHATSYEIRDN